MQDFTNCTNFQSLIPPIFQSVKIPIGKFGGIKVGIVVKMWYFDWKPQKSLHNSVQMHHLFNSIPFT